MSDYYEYLSELEDSGFFDIDPDDYYDDYDPNYNKTKKEDTDEDDAEEDEEEEGEEALESAYDDYSAADTVDTIDITESIIGDDYRGEFPDGIEGDAAYENWLDDIGD